MCWPHPALQVIAQRLSKLGTFKKAGAPGRLPAELLIKRRKRGRNGEVSWEVVRARGHLDEVLEMCKGGCKLGELSQRLLVLAHVVLMLAQYLWWMYAKSKRQRRPD
jgi:cGMP-dependent protein kinase 2